MTISVNVSRDLLNLQNQVAAAEPLTSAGPPTLKAIQLNAITLENDILSDIQATIGNLDTPIMPVDPGGMVAAVLVLVGNAQDQASLTTMYGYVGRSLINLNLLIR